MNSKLTTLLSAYASFPIGVQHNLAKIANHGALAGTGFFSFFPFDQKLEHDPVRTCGSCPEMFNPLTLFNIANEAGVSAVACSIGHLRACAHQLVGNRSPVILKLNHGSGLMPSSLEPDQAEFATVEDALFYGCEAVGYTVYPGSANFYRQMERAAEISRQCNKYGLVFVLWCYPRGKELGGDNQTALDTTCSALEIAQQVAHVVKIKLPAASGDTFRLALKSSKAEWYESLGAKPGELTSMLKILRQIAYGGGRVVVFSGGEKTEEESFMKGVEAIRDAGLNGVICGRNAFQQDTPQGSVAFLKKVNETLLGQAA